MIKTNISRRFYAAYRIDGAKIAQEILETAKKSAENLEKFRLIRPKLAAIHVNGDDASKAYLRRKVKIGASIGVNVEVTTLDASSTSKADLIDVINDLNADKRVHGVIVQLPLPAEFARKSADEDASVHVRDAFIEADVVNAVSSAKDVDGFTNRNLGRLVQGSFSQTLTRIGAYLPCTAIAVDRIIRSLDIETRGKRAAVVGRSLNVGVPIALLLQADSRRGGFDLTTTICHRETKDLKSHVVDADFVVSAVGKAGLITKDMIKPGAVVIDVGISRIKDPETGKVRLKGDVAKDVEEVAGFLTPVPGGVGPCTVAALMSNTVLAAERAALKWPI